MGFPNNFTSFFLLLILCFGFSLPFFDRSAHANCIEFITPERLSERTHMSASSSTNTDEKQTVYKFSISSFVICFMSFASSSLLLRLLLARCRHNISFLLFVSSSSSMNSVCISRLAVSKFVDSHTNTRN